MPTKTNPQNTPIEEQPEEAAAISRPAWRFQYAVKFICGESSGDGVAPGKYFTAINVHNPNQTRVQFKKRFAIALPGERSGPISEPVEGTLDPHQALEIDCPDIFQHVQPAPPSPFQATFLKGFAVIESGGELDVVAVYTAARGAGARIEVLDIERVPPRSLG